MHSTGHTLSLNKNHDLNEKNESVINLEVNNNYLVVKLFKSPSSVKNVEDYQIPIFRYDKIDLSYLSWEISFQHLVLLILLLLLLLLDK